MERFRKLCFLERFTSWRSSQTLFAERFSFAGGLAANKR